MSSWEKLAVPLCCFVPARLLQCNDMHGAKGCNYKSDAQLIAAGDQWTQEFWNALWASPAWKNKKVRWPGSASSL